MTQTTNHGLIFIEADDHPDWLAHYNVTVQKTEEALDGQDASITTSNANAAIALSNSQTALSNSESAIETANTAKETADSALEQSAEALTKANTAITESGEAKTAAVNAANSAADAASSADTAVTTVNNLTTYYDVTNATTLNVTYTGNYWVIASQNMRALMNSDKSYGKIYGSVNFTSNGTNSNNNATTLNLNFNVKAPTDGNPYVIVCTGLALAMSSSGTGFSVGRPSFQVSATGAVQITFTPSSFAATQTLTFWSSYYNFINLGDVEGIETANFVEMNLADSVKAIVKEELSSL